MPLQNFGRLMMLVAMSSFADSAQAQSAASAGVVTYGVAAQVRGSLTLCPGEQVQILVGVTQVTTRSSPSGGPTSVSTTVPHAMVRGRVSDPAIGDISPGIVYTHGNLGPNGGFFVPVTFTAKKIGRTTIDFLGESQTHPTSGNYQWPPSAAGGAAAYQAAPTSVSVTVSCTFEVSLYSVWKLPGERILDVLGVVQSAKLVPSPNTGHFVSNASMSSTAVWIGPCPGVSNIQPAQVTFSGDVTTRVDIDIAFAAASTSTTEGCVGKTSTGPGQPEPLQVSVPIQGGTVNMSHVLRTYVNVPGTTTVVVKRIP